jgi:hypothetical protein
VSADRERWTLSFEPAPDAEARPVAIRVRHLLKRALRSFGLRCVAVSPADALALEPARPLDLDPDRHPRGSWCGRGPMPMTLAPDPALRRRCRAALYEHRRRAAADRQGPLGYGLLDLEALARGATTCAYCGAVLSVATLTFDHATPTCRAADYTLGNLAVCCGSCNTAKGLLTAEEFLGLLALLRTWHPRASGDVLGRLRSGGWRYAVRRRRKET